MRADRRAGVTVSFTSNGSTAVEVAAFSVVFYDASGNELATLQEPEDGQGSLPEYVTAGQTVTLPGFSNPPAQASNLVPSGRSNLHRRAVDPVRRGHHGDEL